MNKQSLKSKYATAKMANRSSVITMSPLVLNQEDDLVIDLDLWEVVNHSDGDYSDDSFSVDSLSDDDVISLDDASFVSPSVVSPPSQMLLGDLAADLDLDDHGVGVIRDEVDENELGWAQRRMVILGGGSRYSIGITCANYVNRDVCYDENDEDHGENEDAYDLDEDLVPRSVTAKLGKQRMRKLGKRAIAKVFTSKTSPYSHLKHGCVRGKHGVGMKFKY